ncbi:hypothetical protein [Alsobacter sp. R-9]
MSGGTPLDRPDRRRGIFRRGPWEAVAVAVIGAGVLMLLQPFSLALYSYSFATTLTGVVLFTIVSKFPE